jgi:transposase InsO family protein
MKFAFIEANRSEFSVMKMCRVLEVSRSGYHAWLARPQSNRGAENEALVEEIREIHKERRGTYGSPRITAELRDRGRRVGKNRVARLMKNEGISGKIAKKFRVQTTDSNHDYPISPNLLEQDFSVSRINRVWASDISYIRVGNGWIYICVVIDLCNREVIGWEISTSLNAEIAVAALRKAIRKRKPGRGVIFHSDRGVQYASCKFRKELKDNGFKQSMSGKGNCYDNAPVESFFHTLKVEEVYRKKYRTFEEAKRNLFDFIEVFYNTTRKHSSLFYMSPKEYLEY